MKRLDNHTDLLQYVCDIHRQHVPFNRLLGIEIELTDPDHIRLIVKKKDELIGNFMHGILHGGVISSVLDVTGGIIATAEMMKKLADQPIDVITGRIANLSTIDLRIDYLRPGRGDWFAAEGSILRIGNKVAVTRTELANDNGQIIAVGTGTYIVG